MAIGKGLCQQFGIFLHQFEVYHGYVLLGIFCLIGGLRQRRTGVDVAARYHPRPLPCKKAKERI